MDLNEELGEIIWLYIYVPKVTNKLFTRVGIHFNLESRDVYLATDHNDTRLKSHNGIKILCEKHHIQFCNQSFAGLIKELRVQIFADKSSKRTFSKVEKADNARHMSGLLWPLFSRGGHAAHAGV